MSICLFKNIYINLLKKNKKKFLNLNLISNLINKITTYNNKYSFYISLYHEKSDLINNKLLLKIFEESQKTFFILNNNIFKYLHKYFISNNKYDLNYDEITSNNIYKLYYNKVIYNFTINDIIMLIKCNIYNYQELDVDNNYSLSVLIEPKYIKNPYTNIDFSINDYYNIYIFLKKNKKIPLIYELFFKSNFNIYQLNITNSSYIINNTFKLYTKNLEKKKKKLCIKFIIIILIKFYKKYINKHTYFFSKINYIFNNFNEFLNNDIIIDNKLDNLINNNIDLFHNNIYLYLLFNYYNANNTKNNRNKIHYKLTLINNLVHDNNINLLKYILNTNNIEYIKIYLRNNISQMFEIELNNNNILTNINNNNNNNNNNTNNTNNNNNNNILTNINNNNNNILTNINNNTNTNDNINYLLDIINNTIDSNVINQCINVYLKNINKILNFMYCFVLTIKIFLFFVYSINLLLY